MLQAAEPTTANSSTNLKDSCRMQPDPSDDVFGPPFNRPDDVKEDLAVHSEESTSEESTDDMARILLQDDTDANDRDFMVPHADFSSPTRQSKNLEIRPLEINEGINDLTRPDTLDDTSMMLSKPLANRVLSFSSHRKDEMAG